jgi:signal transduction histidine kinase
VVNEKTSKFRSIKDKLLKTRIYEILFSFSFVGVLVYSTLTKLSANFLELNLKQSEMVRKNIEKISDENVQKIIQLYTQQFEKKGMSLIKKDATSLSGMVEDNAFSYVREFLRRNLSDDPDVVVSSFFTHENSHIQAWQYVSSRYPNGLNVPINYDLQTKTWKSSYGKSGSLSVNDELVPLILTINEPSVTLREIELETESGSREKLMVYDCITPLYRKYTSGEAISAARKRGDTIGYLRYILSPAGMRKSISDEKNSLAKRLTDLQLESEKTNQESVLMAKASLFKSYGFLFIGFLVVIAVSYFVSRKQSERLTKPVQDLTSIAEVMAQGNYRQKIEVVSEDEIGVLASAFQKMSSAILKRDEDLAEINRNLEFRVIERTAQLNEQLNLVSNLLNNMNQAVFSVSEDGKINFPVSKFAQTLFGEEIAGTNIFDLIYNKIEKNSEDYSKVKSGMFIFGEDELQWCLSKDLFPTEIVTDIRGVNRNLKINYSPLWNESGMLGKLMYVIEDVTELIALKHKVEIEQAKNLRMYTVIQELFDRDINIVKSFFETSLRLISEIELTLKGIKKDRPDALRITQFNLHTLKGNSRSLGLKEISQKIHEVENDVAEHKESEQFYQIISLKVNEIRNLLGMYSGLVAKLRRIEDPFDLNFRTDQPKVAKSSLTIHNIYGVNLNRLESVINELEVTGQPSTFNKVKLAYQQLFSVPAKMLVIANEEMVNEISSNLGKKVCLEIKGDDISFTRDQFSKLNDALGHIIRNAIDHGIERVEERKKSGKPLVATITINCKYENGNKFISVTDDGKGIDSLKIAQIANEKGIATRDDIAKMNSQEIINFILADGFSTSNQITDISGRGVGMSAARDLVESLGGQMVISSEMGKGCEMLIKIAS